ncbi:MAG: phosphatase PAP2 family protein [Deltaproteobacteria bacterium]|nr:phosphatase PAP2 family protein [Deltaproteobacteria bacterium]
MALDVQILEFVNKAMAGPAMDAIMAFFLKKGVLSIATSAALVIAFFTVKPEKRWHVVLGAVAFVIAAALATVMKEVFTRTRPCAVIEGLRVLYGCQESSSFPSRHALAYFAMCVTLSFYFKRHALWLVPFAMLVGLSRMYGAQHYPSDVFAGAALGVVIAVFVVAVDKKLTAAWFIRIKKTFGWKQA